MRSAIHLRTGEPSAAEAVEAWLHDHQVDSTLFLDAYDACVYLLQHSDQVPDLAFVGIDWLAPDELSIIRLIRETWPGSGIVVYASTDEAPPFQPAPPACICRTPAALLQLMTEPPAQVVRRLREQAALAAAHTPEPQTAGTPARTPRKSPDPKPSAKPPAKRGKPHTTTPSGGQTDAAKSAPPGAPPRSMLTNDELSALLDDEDGR